MPSPLHGRDIISIKDVTKDEIYAIFKEANLLEVNAKSKSDILKGKVMALMFFEPSTRTRLSFEVAMKRLGGDVIGFEEPSMTSMAKGESLIDTAKVLESYADIIVVRHPYEGAAKAIADVVEVPVINAGSGALSHPTQTLIDLYTIWREKGRIDGLTILLLGDLKYSRAVRSLVYGLLNFDVNLLLVSPKYLMLREEVREDLKSSGISYVELTSLTPEVVGKADVVYVTRIQKERFADPMDYERVKGSYKLTLSHLQYAKEDLIILHPLPRVDEMDIEIDRTPYAKYFKQVYYGLLIRMALLKMILT
ncbi:MAG: aspartate carbamoyltransferase [Candidatus Nezhaarchaeota archaeon]|nr:aspartate carbamoyltransferase [Candidatus Nezhaarchaeota archaeon]MCX8142059.1 aspartate carbamoyltransferase [Candidatus Nezhaarchaeota archaeon]MDW8050160.1 aspartate carbamoyltransferase [Nitrososphaerota archaeon]